jgi:hypothetical protein
MNDERNMLLTAPANIRDVAKQVCSSKSALTVAVAFWGRGAAKSLGLDARSGGVTRIVLNAQSGACNPAELRLLVKLFGEGVRTHASLHAKVYANEEAVLIGSANASANGLGFDGDDEVDGWAEACMYSRTPSVCAETSDWFEKLWADSVPLSAEIIKQADDLWRRARDLAGRRNASADPLSGGAFVVISHLRCDADALAALTERRRQEPDLDGYQGWKPPCSALLLDFVLKKKGLEDNGAWVSPRRPERLDDTRAGRKLCVVRRASEQQVKAVCGSKAWRHGPAEDVGAVMGYFGNKSQLTAAQAALEARYPAAQGVEINSPKDFCIPLEFFKELVAKASSA